LFIILNFMFRRVSGRFKMGENEEEEVTPEQTDLIVQFSAATGTEDLDQCAANLRVSKLGSG